MKFFIVFLFVCFIVTSCSDNKTNTENSPFRKKDDTSFIVRSNTLEVDTSADNQYANYFIVIVDTNLNYYALNRVMYDCSKKYSFNIDTLGRQYDKTKNLIALPEDSDDELYAGYYFPRRYPSINLSLEYLNAYTANASLKTIALVAGIYDNKSSADSLRSVILPTYNKTFIQETKMYVGCMH